jgi:hypothetical protein
MNITVLLVLAILILLCAVFGAISEKPWRWNVFAVLVGIYVLIQQLPTGR